MSHHEQYQLHSGASIDIPSDSLPDPFATQARKPDRTFWIAVAFTLNFIVGSGVLSLPHAVAGAGIVLAIIFLFVVYLVSFITAGWVVEITGRATLLSETSGQATEEEENEDDNSRLLGGVGRGGGGSINFGGGHVAIVKKKKWELSEMVAFFFGSKARIAFDLCMILFVVATLWLYTSVFANTLLTVAFDETNGTESGWKYYIFVPVFALIVIPLSLMDLSGQVKVQLALTAFAIFIMMLMILTTFASMFHSPDPSIINTNTNATCIVHHDANNQTSKPYFQTTVTTGKALFNFGGFGPLFTTALFSLLCQHGAPSLIQLVEDKTKAKKVFLTSFTTLLVLYSSLSIVTTLYYCTVPKIITDAWADYTDTRLNSNNNPVWWAQAVRYIIEIFPIFTVSTAFPLSARTLSNTLAASCPESLSARLSPKAMKLATTLITVVPPILAGTFVSDVSQIVQYPGLLGFFIMMIVPAILQWKSIREVSSRYGAEVARTPYWGVFSSMLFVGIILCAAAGGLPFALYQTVSTAASTPSTASANHTMVATYFPLP